MNRIGACLSFQNSDLERTIRYAMDIGADTFMIYYGSPTQYAKPKMNFSKIEKDKELLKNLNMEMKDVILHCNYLSNFASPEEKKRETAMNALAQEIEFATKVGIKYLVVHPGSFTTGNPRDGIQYIADCLNYVLEENDDVVICLETMAGKGKELSRDAMELQCIIEKVKLQDKIGFCLDTCHIWDSGYDLQNSLEDTLDEYDGLIGLEKLKVIHLNGSLNVIGSKKDRHARILSSENKIGSEALYNIFHHPKLQGIPFILETPAEEDGNFAFKEEIEFFKRRDKI